MTTSGRPLAALLVAPALLLTACAGTNAVDVGARTPALKTVPDGPTGLFAADGRRAAPSIAGATLDGQRLDVAALRGSVVVVNFWASWCPPCRAEAPALASVAQRRAGQGVRFVGVNIKDDVSAARAFDRRQGVPYPSIVDEAGVVLTRFRALAPQVPPSTLLLDRQGRIAGRFLGPVSEDQLDAAVAGLAAEPS